MSKTFGLVLAILAVWFLVVRKIKAEKIPQAAESAQDKIDNVGQPVTLRTYTT